MELRRNSSATFSQVFNPPISGSPTVTVRDINGFLIPSGNPYVDASNPNLWHVLVTIPSSAPISSQSNQYYTITFNGIGVNSASYVYTQTFNVVAYSELEVGDSLAGLGVTLGYFQDSIVVPVAPDGTPTWTLTTLDTNGVVASSSISSGVVITSTPIFGNNYLQKLSFPLTGAVPLGEYVSTWNWTTSGQPEAAYRQGFIISTRVAGNISQLKMFLDRCGVLKYDGYLLFQDVELADCLWRALDRFNGTSPQLTYYTLDTLPVTLNYVILQIARYEALSRWYLSEGLLSFNFQGGSVSLDVDRTQYIQSMMAELNGYINNDVPRSKSTLAKTLSPGQLAINLGPNNNYIGNATPNQLYSLRRVSLR